MNNIPTPEELILSDQQVQLVLDRFLEEIKIAIVKGHQETNVFKMTGDEMVVPLLQQKGWLISWQGHMRSWHITW